MRVLAGCHITSCNSWDYVQQPSFVEKKQNSPHVVSQGTLFAHSFRAHHFLGRMSWLEGPNLEEGASSAYLPEFIEQE